MMTIYQDSFLINQINQGSLHELVNSPVDEGAFGVHQMGLVVQPGPGLRDGRGVGQLHTALATLPPSVVPGNQQAPQ